MKSNKLQLFMNKNGYKKLSVGLAALATVAGLATFGLTPKPVYAYWQEHYRHEYKIRVKRPTKVYMVVYSKRSDYLDKIFYYTTVHRGEVVRTWFAGASEFNWHLTGGRFGSGRNTHYGFSVDWKSPKSFKILKTYHGYNWF